MSKEAIDFKLIPLIRIEYLNGNYIDLLINIKQETRSIDEKLKEKKHKKILEVSTWNTKYSYNSNLSKLKFKNVKFRSDGGFPYETSTTKGSLCVKKKSIFKSCENTLRSECLTHGKGKKNSGLNLFISFEMKFKRCFNGNVLNSMEPF